MQRRLVLTALVALTVAAAGCTGDDDRSDAVSKATNAEALAFCEAWNNARASGDESALDQALADPPSEIEDEAAAVRAADPTGPESAEVETAMSEISDWTELHCPRGEDGERRRRLAPPLGADLAPLNFCQTFAFPATPRAERSGIVLYGRVGRGDRYDGPMLGVVWNPADDGGHEGDGETHPVNVRGRKGVAAPITVFQQTILPELGTVIAWTEGDLAVGLYGRGWSLEHVDELVAIANRLEVGDGRLTIPDDALPAGYGEVFAGDPRVTSIVFPPSSLYSVRYQAKAGLLDLTGLEMSQDEFQAFRFFTIGVDQGVVAGREALVGNAWHARGPAVVTWRESDGLVIRIVGIGVSLETARQVAAETRELTSEQWEALVEAENPCEFGPRASGG